MIRTIGVLLVGVSTMLALGAVAAVSSAIFPRSYMTLRLGRVWSRLILRAAGIRVRYHGIEHTGGGSRVFMANHQSFVDIWALIPVLPLPTMFAAKSSLYTVPGLGWAMRASGFTSIDRGDRNRAIRSLTEAASRVRDGRPIVFFPEGTRSRDGRLQPFKKGPFHLALEAGAAVVPVAISGSFAKLPPGTMRIRSGEVEVCFAPPVETTPYRPDDLEGLMNRVHAEIAERLDRSAEP